MRSRYGSTRHVPQIIPAHHDAKTAILARHQGHGHLRWGRSRLARTYEIPTFPALGLQKGMAT